MRLLDLIAQGRCPRVVPEERVELPGALPYSAILRECPLRYVLTDPLVVCATQLGFAEGERLSSCLDLVFAPARCVWVEWADGPRQEALRSLPGLNLPAQSGARRAGCLVQAGSSGRTGEIRTFWSTPQDLAYLSPVITDFDLDGAPQPLAAHARALAGWDAVVRVSDEPALDELLSHLRFRFDATWAGYYGQRCADERSRSEVLRRNLSACAFDGPMLMAFFLLLAAGALLPRQPVRHEQLNRARRRAGKAELLEHVEVSAPLGPIREHRPQRPGDSGRAAPRLHHVRGHIVRRGSTIYWRSPHLRGSARIGQIRSRTVVLRFPHTAPQVQSSPGNSPPRSFQTQAR
ncbi:MAG TPA: hypothetical protein VMT29_01440 [Steroidobacteraceae bacterium]|nr:hypothetical protein [Steroidobacteraceae bacterium]